MACTTFGSMLESGNTQERESKGQNTRCPCSVSYTFTAAWGFQSCTCADGHWLLGENSGCLFLKSEKKKQGVKQHGHNYGESTIQEVPGPGWGQAWLLNLSQCLCFYVLLGICNRGLCLAGGTPLWKQQWQSRFSIVEPSLFNVLCICTRLASSLHCWHTTLGGSGLPCRAVFLPPYFLMEAPEFISKTTDFLCIVHYLPYYSITRHGCHFI